MALLAAVNYEDRLVLLEDGRELPITQFYAALPGEPRLTASSELRKDQHLDSYHGAEVFAVNIPGVEAALICEIAAIDLTQPNEIN